MKCDSCGADVTSFETRCHVCMSDIGFPNVRAANLPAEQKALGERLAAAFVSARARGADTTLIKFGEALQGSKAVISKPMGVVKNIVDSGNQLITAFYGQVASGARLPEDNRFDRARPGIDGTLFPHYHEHINFGALSLDGIGVGGNYGACHLTLRDPAVAQRATVFEENAFIFCTTRHRIIVGGQIPRGYRAKWQDRHKLARAKHQPDLDRNTLPAQFPRILLRPAATVEDEVFIEVHIYGPIHRGSIETMTCQKPANGPDVVIWRALKKSLKQQGVSVVETP